MAVLVCTGKLPATQCHETIAVGSFRVSPTGLTFMTPALVVRTPASLYIVKNSMDNVSNL